MTTKPICPKIRGSMEIISYPCIVEPKYDGEWNNFVTINRQSYLVNKYGRVRTGKLVDELEQMFNPGKHTLMLIGELYYGEGKKGDLYKLNANKNSDDLSYVPFDIVYYYEKDLKQLPLVQRKEILAEFPGAIRTFMAHNKRQVEMIYEELIREGYEGVVVKNMNSILSVTPEWVKIKEKDTNILPISYIDPYRERIVVKRTAVTETGVKEVEVSLKCPTSVKAALKVGDLVKIEHLGVTKSGSLRNAIFKGVYKNKEQMS